MPKLKEHSFDKWSTVKAPTESETGLAKGVCTVCGIEQNKELPIGTKIEDESSCNSSFGGAATIAVAALFGGVLLKKRKKD